MKKIILGLILSALFIYLSLRGIDMDALLHSLKRIDFSYALISAVILVVMQIVRSVRWGVLLAPLEKVSQPVLFAITSVGFLAIVAIPARLGELVRPYLIAKKSSIPMSSALATIFMERLLDSVTVLIILATTLILTPLPSWLVKSGVFVLGITVLAFVLIIFVHLKKEYLLNLSASLTRRLSPRWHGITHTIGHFIGGFGIMADGKRFAIAGLFSLTFWLLDAFSIYLLFKAFKINLPFMAAVVIMLVLLVGIAIPTAPGFIGNWHFACVMGLAIFGIGKAEALSFAIVYHFITMIVILSLGLFFLPSYTFSFGDLKKSMRF